MSSPRLRFLAFVIALLTIAGLTPARVAAAQEDTQGEEAIVAVEDVDAGGLDDAVGGVTIESTAAEGTTGEGAATSPIPAAGDSATASPVSAEGTAHLAYHTHVQTYGWQGWVQDGAEAGTSGESKRLEAIEIALADADYEGGVEYRTHVQTYGWQGWVANGAASGTTGESKRLEAIQIQLTGAMAEHYDVWYRTHVQTFGWLGWACNGARSGTATFSKRMEAMQILILPKGSAAPGDTSNPYVTSQVRYHTHVQTYGWQDWSHDGELAGTTGQSKRLEAIEIMLPDADYEGGVEYRTHVQTYGWQGWVANGAASGTTGESKRLEAIQIQLTGAMAEHYDVWYRVHAQTFGWLGWACNGQESGTAGLSKRLEAIQILLVPKDAPGPSYDYSGISSNNAAAFVSGNVGSVGSASSITGSPTSPGASAGGALHVAGNQLVDQHGAAIQLRGVSTHGLAWYPGYVNDACFSQLRNNWNANLVRLVMYTEEYGGYCSGGNQDDLRNLVKEGVRLATSNDLYVIVDWHILSDNDPNRHVDEAKAFFNDISAIFSDNTNVLYEICNEPNGGTSWEDIKRYANQVIPVIRAHDPDAVVIVGTPTWSQEIDKAAASPLGYDNLMYTLHFYAATHKDDLRDRMVNCVRSGLPVFVSEFGICDASGNGAIDEGSANSWMSAMNELGVSWCMWSLCNKAESASVLKSSCGATSGFGTDDLATSGTWLLRALSGTLPAGSSTISDNAGSSVGSGATSGTAVGFSSGNFACTATLSNSWPAGNGQTCYQYELTITNRGGACTSWNVTIPFNRNVACTSGWNATFAANGSRLAVGNMSYNGTIGAGATVSGIGFQVTADAGLAVAP